MSHDSMKEIPLYDLPEEEMEVFGFKMYRLKNRRNASDAVNIPLKTNIPHRHNFYEVCIFQDGGGTHEIDFQLHEVSPLSIHFVSPGQVHLLEGGAENNGYVMAFTTAFFSDEKSIPDWLTELPFFGLLAPVKTIQLNQDQFAEVIEILALVIKDYQKILDKSRPIIQAYLKVFLLKCFHFFDSQSIRAVELNTPSVRLVHRYKALIEKDHRIKRKVEDYAQALNVSTSSVNKSCKRVLGVTASYLINKRLILEAKRLLIFSDWSSKEIAYYLGFSDPSYFNRFFKKIEGVPPHNFKKAVLDRLN